MELTSAFVSSVQGMGQIRDEALAWRAQQGKPEKTSSNLRHQLQQDLGAAQTPASRTH